MMQHEQSSPHQHGSLTTGFASGPLTIDGEEEPEVVEGGIVSVCGCWVLVGGDCDDKGLVGRTDVVGCCECDRREC